MPRKRDGDTSPGDTSAWQFMGFQSPTYTQTPDEVFDWLMARLSGAEVKVLLYIIRRTFGFKKNADAISIEQICSGIVTKSGKRLDMGTGLGRTAVTDALRSLKEKNIIVIRSRILDNGGSGPSLYSLNVLREEEEATEDDPRHQRWEGGSGRTDGGIRISGRGDPVERMGGSAKTEPSVRSNGRGGSTRTAPQETVEQETDHQERDNSNYSNDPPSEQRPSQTQMDEPRTATRYSDFIAQVTRDYTRLFHDGDHERPNRSRALRLWAESNLPEQQFVDLMHQARKITQARGNIARDATDGSPSGTKNRMPYYFSVLEDLLDLQQDAR